MIRRHFSLVNIDKVSSRECVNRDEISLSAPGQGRAPPTAPTTTPSPFPQARNTACQRLPVVDALRCAPFLPSQRVFALFARHQERHRSTTRTALRRSPLRGFPNVWRRWVAAATRWKM